MSTSLLSTHGRQVQGRRPRPSGACPPRVSRWPVSRPGDSREQQAERMAQQAVRDTGPALTSRCACGGGCPRCAPRVRPRTDDDIDAVLNSTGQPLDAATAVELGSRFNQDLRRVRVHDDVHASESARALSAHAWTSGEHIAFGEGQYRPGTHTGRHLIAHELAHVLQDRAAPAERRLARFTMDSCEEADHEKIRAADARATAMAAKALPLLRQYRNDGGR